MFEEYGGACRVAAILLSHATLAFQEITTHIPYEIYVAVSRGTTRPRLDHPPLRVFWFTDKAFTEGIETHVRDGVSVRVYSPEKTLADCFKYRNKIGIDTVSSRLWDSISKGSQSGVTICSDSVSGRVSKVMKPYLEALL